MHVNPNTSMDKAKQFAKRAGTRIMGRPREQRDKPLPQSTTGCPHVGKCLEWSECADPRACQKGGEGA